MAEKQCNDCLPDWISNGWLGSFYFWYYLLLTAAVIFVSVSLNDVSSDWFKSLQKPWGYPSEMAFTIIWSILYLAIFIGVLIAGLDGKNPNTRCIVIGYTLLLLTTLLWIVSFTKFHMIFISNLDLIVTFVFTLWVIWLVLPQRTGKNIFPVIAFSALAMWLLYASYLGWSIQYLNPSS